MKIRATLNPPVFFSSILLIFGFVLFGALMPQRANTLFSMIQKGIIEKLGWFYVLSVALFLIFVLYLAISRHGDVKLGADHSEPEFSYKSWFAMLFSAGMGIGLMYFGVAEPVMHFLSPPKMEAGTVEAAKEAMKITFFHWGIHAWAIYALVALALAYFSFRHQLPFTIRSAFYPLIGERIKGRLGDAIDTFAVISTMFGVATSLGFGVLQVNSGLSYLFEIPNTIWTQILLIAFITSLATISVVLGLSGGIKRLSELNLFLAIALMIFVLLAGPTLFIIQTFVQNIGAYLSDLTYKTFNLHAYEPTGWIGGWTIFYWAWWIAWSPFVGMFIARISKGRTIREFVIGVLMVPVGFTFLWLTVFGDSAIFLILKENLASLGSAVQADSTTALFKFLESLPFSFITSLLATILIITFFVTSSDSGSLVIDMLTSGGIKETPLWQRIFWSSSEGFVAAALLLAGGLGALQTASIIFALPFSIIMLFMAYGMHKALRIEAIKKEALKVQGAITFSPSHSPIPWQKRLKNLISRHKKSAITLFIQERVFEAITAVAQELEREGVLSKVKKGEGSISLEVLHGEEIDFLYEVRNRGYTSTTFIMSSESEDEIYQYHRAEVFLKEGSQGYDLMGYSKEQIIADILNQYRRHMQFLHLLR